MSDAKVLVDFSKESLEQLVYFRAPNGVHLPSDHGLEEKQEQYKILSFPAAYLGSLPEKSFLKSLITSGGGTKDNPLVFEKFDCTVINLVLNWFYQGGKHSSFLTSTPLNQRLQIAQFGYQYDISDLTKACLSVPYTDNELTSQSLIDVVTTCMDVKITLSDVAQQWIESPGECPSAILDQLPPDFWVALANIPKYINTCWRHGLIFSHFQLPDSYYEKAAAKVLVLREESAEKFDQVRKRIQDQHLEKLAPYFVEYVFQRKVAFLPRSENDNKKRKKNRQ